MDSSQQQKQSKKRDFDAYTKGKNGDADQLSQQTYEQVNLQYKQLYQERQQQKLKQLQQMSTNSTQDQTQKENCQIQLQTASINNLSSVNGQASKTLIKEDQNLISKQSGEQQKVQMKAVNQMPTPQNFNSNFQFKIQKSQFFINKLKQYPREEQTPNMLKFQDIFSKNPFYEYFNEQPERADVQSIFMTTYGYETELLLPILKSNKHFVLANDKSSSDKDTKDIIKENDGFKNWTLIHPPKDNLSSWGGAFHPKLWLIKFSDFLRVVIGSGNLHVSDWSVWSNCFWYQDFPLQKNQMKDMGKTQEQSQNKINWDFEGDFKSTLIEIVTKMMPKFMNYKELLKIDLDQYDYSGVKVILVSNVVGRYQDITKYGKGKLHKIVECFKPVGKPEQENQQNEKIITYQCTSIGSIDTKFLNEFYTCATSNKPLKNEKKDKSNKNTDNSQIVNNFKLIFPTAEYIYEDTIYGPEYASPVILNQKYYEKDSFPKQIFHQFCSPDHYFYHTGVIPHLKIMTVTDNQININDDSLIYIGSHNFTAAAWGRFEKDFTQIYSSNTELGIVFPPIEGSAEIKQEIVNTLSFKLNAPKYSANMKPFVRNFE